jgi:hypothetical protein
VECPPSRWRPSPTRKPAPLNRSTTSSKRAAVLLLDASAVVGALVPDMPQPPPDTAVGVVSMAVLRALATPSDGLSTETVGEVSRTAAHSGSATTPVPPAPRGAFTIWTV